MKGEHGGMETGARYRAPLLSGIINPVIVQNSYNLNSQFVNFGLEVFFKAHLPVYFKTEWRGL